MSTPRNFEYIIKWCEKNRPELVDMIKNTKDNSTILLLSIGFESGRLFQHDNKYEPLGPAAYLSEPKRKLEYLSPAYFDEIIYRHENAVGFTPYIGVRDVDEWMEAFRKHSPLITTARLEHIKGNAYSFHADI